MRIADQTIGVGFIVGGLIGVVGTLWNPPLGHVLMGVGAALVVSCMFLSMMGKE